MPTGWRSSRTAASSPRGRPTASGREQLPLPRLLPVGRPARGAQTDDPTELLHRLTSDAIARGERLDGLEVTRPTLEDVYLELTRSRPSEPDRALTWQQFRFERKLFWRNPSAAFFNFLLPLLLLFLIATAFSREGEELEILIPGIAGMSVMATTFTSLAFNVSVLREEGILKRCAGNADAGRLLPGRADRLGGLNAFIQVLIVVAIGHVLYGVEWPQDLVLLAGVPDARRDLLRARSGSHSRTRSRTWTRRPPTRTRCSCR